MSFTEGLQVWFEHWDMATLSQHRETLGSSEEELNDKLHLKYFSLTCIGAGQ